MRGVLYVFGEEDGAGTGAEGWRGFDEGLQGVEEAVALEEFQEGGGLAARDDEAVDVGEFGWGADELCGYAEGSERFGVGFECALEGEDADGERFGGGCTPLPLDFAQSLHSGHVKSGPVVSDRHSSTAEGRSVFLDPWF